MGTGFIARRGGGGGLSEGTATGGTEVTSGGYQYHVFTGSGALTITGGFKAFEYLVVGSGGRGQTGGAGAGAIEHGTAKVTSNVTVVVGAGGSGTGTSVGNPGNVSSIAWDTTTSNTFTITAIGGGGGMGPKDGYAADGKNHGGCGGGGSVQYFSGLRESHESGGFGLKGIYDTHVFNDGRTGAAIVNFTYGFNGGSCTPNPSTQGTFQGAGGGGASAAGESSGTTSGFAGDGGDGTSDFSAWLSAVSGSVTLGEESSGTYYICGGGAGAGRTGVGATITATGGLGGGGNTGNAGDANTGGGGGNGGDGGSGFVIIRYEVT